MAQQVEKRKIAGRMRGEEEESPHEIENSNMDGSPSTKTTSPKKMKRAKDNKGWKRRAREQMVHEVRGGGLGRGDSGEI